MRKNGHGDPIDPQNWPLRTRSKTITILCILIFIQSWAGSADAPANKQASREFGVSRVAENLSTSMYLFGIGSGSLFAGPLSESIGRNPTYLGSTFIYLLFLLGSGLTPTFAGQVVCRYFVGLFSSGTLSINGSSVSDQFRPVKRALVFPIIAWANIAGGYAAFVDRFMLTWLRCRPGSWPDRWRVDYFTPKPRLAVDRVYLSHCVSRSMDRGSYLSARNIFTNTTRLESEANTTQNR